MSAQSISSSIPFEIRPFNLSEDGQSVLQIIISDLKNINSQVYSPDVIDSMIKGYTLTKLEDLSKDKERIILVATENSNVVGTASLLKDSVRMMFVDQQLHCKGIGKALLQRIEKIANDNGISKLNVSSSLNADGFYEKMGFTKVGIEITKQRGTCILMTKTLSLEKVNSE